jgi:UDP-2,3-diacylglucosamine pyrophosphatase LpxH
LNAVTSRAAEKLLSKKFSIAAYAKKKTKNLVGLIGKFEDVVLQSANDNDTDGVICGHIHHPELRNEKGFVYANCGDWVENCTALIEDYQGTLRLLHYSDRLKWKEQQISTQLNAA